jgi:hypothetical protein
MPERRQAVIAIENLRLFDEVQAQKRELRADSDFGGAERYFTLAGGVDTGVRAMLADAMRVCEAKFGHLVL